MAAALPEMNSDIVYSAWDYKGHPAMRSATGGWTGAITILVVELNERLTSLGIAVNLVTYMTHTMHLGNAVSANAVTNFLGTSFMLCLLGGFIADTFLGRYLTIAIFTTVQAIGVTILTISTIVPELRPPKCTASVGPCVPATDGQLSFLYVSLYLTALGTGGLKSSVSGFGSHQFDESDRREKNRMIRFFNWFFFFINLGSLLAVTVLVYIQDNLGRRWGYGIIAASIFAGLALFLSGTRRYRFMKLVGSPITQIAAVFVSAWRKRRLVVPLDTSLLYDVGEAEGWRSKGKEPLPHTPQFRFLDHAAVKEEVTSRSTNMWRLNTLTDVEEVKQVLRMLPIWASTILFWTIYAQMTTFSVSQATTMDRHFITSSFEIPAGSLTVFFVGSILLIIPIYDRIIVPIFRRFTGNAAGLTPLQRIALGLFLSTLAMVAAALTEIKRLHVATSTPGALDDSRDVVIPLSVFWLVPQFLLVGTGEAFTYIGQLDFFLRECPKGMKAMSAGLFLSTLSLGFFVSTALVTVVHKVTGEGGEGAWLADNLNRGKLHNFYWLLAVLSLLNLAAYLVCARWYVYKDGHAAVAVVSAADKSCLEMEEEEEEVEEGSAAANAA